MGKSVELKKYIADTIGKLSSNAKFDEKARLLPVTIALEADAFMTLKIALHTKNVILSMLERGANELALHMQTMSEINQIGEDLLMNDMWELAQDYMTDEEKEHAKSLDK